jgi:hypothetical protein
MYGWVRSSWPETYGHFRSRDVKYYYDFADACDQLRSQFPDSVTNIPPDLIPYGGPPDLLRDLKWHYQKRKVPGDDQSLPPLIRALKAEYVLFNYDRVFISFGAGRMAWAIMWEQHNLEDDSMWELATNIDGTRQGVFSRKKAPAPKQ